MPAAYSIKCPSCGGDFLATQTRPTSITTCPHCAFNAPLQDFQSEGMATIGPATALPLRRRDPRTHHQPVTPAPLPQPVAPQPPSPSEPAAPQPGIEPSIPSAAGRQKLTPPPLTPASVPPPPLFPEVPAIPSPFESIPDSAPPPPPPPPEPSPKPFLPQSFSADPSPPPTPDSFVPQVEFAHLAQSAQKPAPPSFWRSFLGVLIFIILAAAAAGLLWKNRSIEPTSIEASRTSPSSSPNLPPALNPSTPPKTPAYDPIATQLVADRVFSEGPDLLRQLLARPAENLALVHQGERFRPQITAFFERHARITAVNFQNITTPLIDLPSGQPVHVIRVITSANPDRGALLRFQVSPDNRLLIDWPLFEESHEGAFAQFNASQNEDAGSRWFTVGLRRNHGLDLDEIARSIHHAFDIQADPNGSQGKPTIVVRDLPVGRFIDQRTDWRIIYMTRLLLRQRTLDSGLKCLEIIDCEGLGLARGTPPASP